MAEHPLPEATPASATPHESSIADLERAVRENPTDAQALVRLANAYWLDGHGPDVVGDLADRARTLDPSNRGAWHLWALAEASPRARTERWRQVTEYFPEDDLARASLADNAASLAGAEHDPVALALALDTYQQLRDRATRPEQRDALDTALLALKNWRF